MITPSWQQILLALFIMALSSMVIWAVNAGAFNKGEVQEKDHKEAAAGVKWSAVIVLIISVAIVAIPLFTHAREKVGQYTLQKTVTTVAKAQPT